jgi:hypothetical protein
MVWGVAPNPTDFFSLDREKVSKKRSRLRLLRSKNYGQKAQITPNSLLRSSEAQTGVILNRLLSLFFGSPAEVIHILMVFTHYINLALINKQSSTAPTAARTIHQKIA